MAITITLPTILARHAAGVRAHTVSGTTVREALANISRDFPVLGQRLEEATAPETQFVAIYLNDEDTRHLQGVETPLTDGDAISVVSAIAGG